MIDRRALALLRPVTDGVARRLARAGIGAEAVTWTGFGFALIAAGLIALGHPLLAIAPLLLSRACDGLDGALARLSTPTDRGAFLDIALDFLFYALIPLGFAVLDPGRNALAAAVLLAAFVGTGASFLAFAVIAEKRGLKSAEYPTKSFYYLGGLTEGAETIACFLLMCLMPGLFPVVAYAYAGLCALTIATRIHAGWTSFGPPGA